MSDQKNPWLKSEWNLTEQMRMLKERGLEYAREQARRAGLDPDGDPTLGLYLDEANPPARKPAAPVPLDLSAARERRFRQQRPYWGVDFFSRTENR